MEEEILKVLYHIENIDCNDCYNNTYNKSSIFYCNKKLTKHKIYCDPQFINLNKNIVLYISKIMNNGISI